MLTTLSRSITDTAALLSMRALDLPPFHCFQPGSGNMAISCQSEVYPNNCGAPAPIDIDGQVSPVAYLYLL